MKVLKQNKSRIYIIMLFITTITMGAWGLNIIPALGPTLQSVMFLNEKTLGMLMSSFYIGTAAMAILYSFYFDHLKIKTALIGGLLSISFFLAIIGILIESVHTSVLVIFVIFAGMGYGLINPAINKGIVLLFPRKIRSTMMSFKQMGVMFGSMLSAAILPSVAHSSSIPFSFIFTSVLIAVLAIIILFSYAININDSSSKVKHVQMKKKALLKILTDRNLLLCNIASMLLVGAQFSFIMYIALYFRVEFRFDIVHAGFILSLASLGGAIGRLFWGIVSDYFNKRKTVLIIIGFISLLFCFIIAFLPLGTANYIIYSSVLIYGFSIGGWNGVLQALVVELADEKLAGIISGYTLSTIYFATFLIPLLFGILIDFVGGYRVAWILSGISIFIATFLFFIVKEGDFDSKGGAIAWQKKFI